MPTLRLALGICVLAGVACATSGSRNAEHRVLSDLPVSRAVLYQNGVGYFERQGWVHDNRVVLRALPEQIGDLLKSLTLVSMSGGRAVSASLPADPSATQKLAQLPEQLRSGGGLVAIATALRGARVEVRSSEGNLEGRLVGVEGDSTDGSDSPGRARLSVLADEGAVSAVSISSITQLKVQDDSLRLGLQKSLDVSLGESRWKPVDLQVRLEGPRDQELVVSYLVEMPKWRPAYRVVLGGGTPQDHNSIFQGWAVVDNLSGEDWHDVKLSLVSGTPLAFRYDLYTPLYSERPDLTPADRQPAAAVPEPVDAEGGGEAVQLDERDMEEERNAPSAPPSASMAPAPMLKKLSRQQSTLAAPPAPSREQALQNSFGALVSGTAVGSVFRYDIETPVTIADQQSALVLLANKQVQGEEVLLFRVGQDNAHPYRAVRLQAPADLVLERGPVAIYRSGTFLGEALSGHVEGGATTFLPFALDGRVRVDLREHTEQEDVRLIKAVAGVISIEVKQVTHSEYTVANNTPDALTLWIARPKRPNWNMVGPGTQRIIEEGGITYLPMDLPAHGPKTPPTTVDVREETPVQRTVDVNSANGRHLLFAALQRGDLAPEVAAKLRDVRTMLERIHTIEEQGASLESQKNVYSEREQNVRDNLRALGKGNSDIKHTLETSMLELEKKLQEVSRTLVTLNIERQKLRDTLAATLAGISLNPGSN